MSVFGKLEGEVFRFGRDEKRTVQSDIRGVAGFVLEHNFSEAPINSGLVVGFEKLNEFIS
jgi:hypothetical protein